MSQSGAHPERAAGFERRSRYRFEIARSQMLAASAALALLAILLFLSGLAIGLLINPRLTPAGSVMQSAVLPRAPEPPAPRQNTDSSRVEKPPTSRYGLIPSRSHEPTWQSLHDTGSVVWRPREQRLAMASLRSEPSTPHVASLPPSTQREEGMRADVLPVTSEGSIDEPTVVSPPEQLARIEDDASLFQPRATSGLAQPPSRWRRSMPLAAAFLTAPEDAFTPGTGGAVDGVDADGTESPSAHSPWTRPLTTPSQETLSEEIPAESESRRTVGPRTRIRPATPTDDGVSSTSADVPAVSEDGGWQPSSSHWQTFVGTLGIPRPSIAETQRSEAQVSETERIDAKLAPAVGGNDGELSDPVSAEELSAEPESGEWQPSSRLWQSFLDAPYDWSVDRLPPAPTRRVAASGSQGVPYGYLIDRAAADYGLDAALVAAMVQVESSYDADAVSPKGARGLMQVMPSTAQRFGVTADQLFDPDVNLEVGVRYLSWLRERFAGETKYMLAAYNAGEAAVESYGGVPPYAETREYIERIYALMGWAVEPSAQTGGSADD